MNFFTSETAQIWKNRLQKKLCFLTFDSVMYCTIWEDTMDLPCPPNRQQNLSCRIYSPYTLGAEYILVLKKMRRPQIDMLSISWNYIFDGMLWKEKKKRKITPFNNDVSNENFFFSIGMSLSVLLCSKHRLIYFAGNRMF